MDLILKTRIDLLSVLALGTQPGLFCRKSICFRRSFPRLAILWNGEPLRCEKCYKDGLTCSGRNRLCDYDLKTCVVVLVEYTHYGKPQLRAVKACEHTNVCNTPLQYLNMGRGIYERSNVICCIGEACKTAAPRFQPGFITPNGKSCPACFATDISHCGSARVDCSGNEFHCISTFHEVWEHGGEAKGESPSTEMRERDWRVMISKKGRTFTSEGSLTCL
nr:phospholipase A2 inhibitor and Ly6/PLAUR domain-containing protein-like [Anolis sagrei ordinatus]